LTDKHWKQFPLFHSHLDLAHQYWKKILNTGECAIDATCGNGHDSLVLSKLLFPNDLNKNGSKLFVIDCQIEAIQCTKEQLKKNLTLDCLETIQFFHQCHSSFPLEIQPHSIKLIVYNLGYLPGGNKQLTTTLSTTVQSLKSAIPLIHQGGVISITCYPGHPEGKIEELGVLDFITSLNPQEWSCCTHRWMNRKKSPSLVMLQKKLN
jgi:Putative rRNA methylase